MKYLFELLETVIINHDGRFISLNNEGDPILWPKEETGASTLKLDTAASHRGICNSIPGKVIPGKVIASIPELNFIYSILFIRV